MAQTVASSDFYRGWLDSVDKDLNAIRQGIREHNFEQVAQTAEQNALKMHSTMLTTRPPIVYWNSTTIQLIHLVHDLRDQGMPVYFTIDGGPQVKIICKEDDVDAIQKALIDVPSIQRTVLCKAGVGAKVIQEHLF